MRTKKWTFFHAEAKMQKKNGQKRIPRKFAFTMIIFAWWLIDQAVNSVHKNSDKSTGTPDHWEFLQTRSNFPSEKSAIHPRVSV